MLLRGPLVVPYNLNVLERIAGLVETTRGTNRTRGARVVALLHCLECIVTHFILQSKALLHRDALFGGKNNSTETAQRALAIPLQWSRFPEVSVFHSSSLLPVNTWFKQEFIQDEINIQ